MTYQALIKLFLQMIQKIKSLNPAYKQPGDGSNGICDCIGLIIGAIRRMGLTWSGIHGSNYAARYQIKDLKPINSVSELELGDIVLKGCPPNSTKHKWDLPQRYRKGGAYYNGDLTDYYHAGAVTSVNPLNITHMTSPRMKVDTKLNHNKNSIWNYHGKALPIIKAAGSNISIPTPSHIPSTGSVAIVIADSGSTVNLRIGPSLNKNILYKVPLNEQVEIVSPGETWAKVKYKTYTGYIMAKFLDVVGDGKGKY